MADQFFMWDILQDHLVEFLQNNISDIDIQAGIPEGEDIPSEKAIRVCRGKEDDIQFFARSSSTVTMMVECWNRSDSQNISDANKLLAALERQFFLCLADWIPQVQKDLKIRISSVEIPNMQTNGEMFRPMIGSTTTLVIKWNK